jgi:cell wall-associated NlpC family hydrolase
MKYSFFILLFLLTGKQCCISQKEEVIKEVDPNSSEPDQEVRTDFAADMVSVGKQLIGKPYKAHTLEVPGNERLVVLHDAFDCTTFVEYCMASAKHMQKPEAKFESQIKQIRYWMGDINRYGSRLHYFLLWKEQQLVFSNMIDITEQLGGVPYTKKIQFMSKNPKLYPALSDSIHYHQILWQEKAIMSKKHHYIPKGEVPKMQSKLKSGDIVAFTTTIKDLDVSHMGIIVMKDKVAHLLHASQTKGRVELSEVTLNQMLQSNKTWTGIIVLRK